MTIKPLQWRPYLLLLALLFPGCHQYSKGGGLHLTSRSPEGAASGIERDVIVDFDRPVVSEKELGHESASGPITLRPKLDGTFRWASRSRLLFHPATLPRSTEFQVRLDDVHAADGASLGESPQWTFSTERLEVTDLRPSERRYVAPLPEMTLAFSQPVVPADVAAACSFAPKTGPTVEARLLDGQDAGAVRAVTIAPARALERSADYELRCAASLHGAEGPLGMAAAYASPFHTYGDLRVVSSSPSARSVDTDDLKIEIELSNPLELKQITRHLSSVPPIAGLGGGTIDGKDHRTYRVQVNVDASTEYTIALDGATKDLFGQKLGARYEFQFQSGDAKPRVSMGTGTFLVEAKMPRFPLWVRNVKRLDVSAAMVPEDRIVPLLVDWQGDDWWVNEEAENDEERQRRNPARGWKKLGLVVHEQRVEIAAPLNKWQDGALDLQALSGATSPRGVFVMAVRAPEEDAAGDRHRLRQVLANASNLGLVSKLGGASGLVWAVHLSNGKPAAGIRIDVRDARNVVRFSGITTGDGTLATPGTRALTVPLPTKGPKLRTDEMHEEEGGGGRGGTFFTIAREGDDLAVVSTNWQDGISAWNFDLPSDVRGAGRPERIRGFIQTDRGLFRPGETVHLKGLARSVRLGEGLRVPTDKQVEVTIKDPHGDEKLRRTVTLTPFSGFALDLPLNREARLGDWSVEARLGQGADEVTFRDTFSVEEYRPATFEVKLQARKANYTLGESVRADLTARYLYGAPLVGGKVEFNVRRRDHFARFDAWSEFTFEDLDAMERSGDWWARDGERSYSWDVNDEKAELDGEGKAQLRFSTTDSERAIESSQDFLVSATVTDASNQAVSTSAAIVAHRSSLYLGLRTFDWCPETGKPFRVAAVAVDTEGKPRAVDAELVVSLRRWECGWTQAKGAYSSGYRCEARSTEVERRKVTLPATGATDLQVTVAQPGTVVVSLRAADKKGRAVTASTSVWAVGHGEASWRQTEDARFPLVASQKRYRPGDTARLVAQAPLDGATALVTLERDGVLAHWVQPFTSSGDGISVPLTDKLAPNVFASVVLVRGRTGEGDRARPTFGMGLVSLEVDASGKKLDVKVSTDRPSYRPGELVKARVEVKGTAGEPVAAEVALAVADEGVLQLIGYKTPDPTRSFYAMFGLGVDSSTNWNRLALRGDPNGDDEGEGGDSGAGSGKPRSKFLSTAFWAPALVTGADGSAEVTFTAPDNLTAFRVMASAADGGNRFGAGEVRMTVAKPLVALPAVPRFFSVGDSAVAGVVVQNNTGAAGSAEVSITATHGLTTKGAQHKTVALAAGASKAVLFELSAHDPGAAKLTFHAALGDEKDALEVTVPIERPVEAETLLVGEGEVAAGSPVTLPFALPGGALVDRGAEGGLEVVLDATGLAGVDEGLRYLVEYPYGCLEQTTSRVIPMVMVNDLARSLDLPGLRGAELHEFVDAGIAKILRHQHDDGAFSLWPSSSTEPFLTAFALYGLTTAKRAGFDVDKRAIEQGLDALRAAIAERRGMGNSDNPLGEAGSRAFALYVLADLGHADAGAMAKLFSERAALPVFGQAFLARAFVKAKSKGDEAKVLVEEIAAHAVPIQGHDEAARITDSGQEHLWWYFSSDTRTSAIALSALLEAAPDHPLVARLARGLLLERSGGKWNSTQDNLFSLVALSQYAKARSKAGAASRVTVALDGKVLFDGKLGSGTSIRRVRVPIGKLAASKGGSLSITPTGGTLSYSARLHVTRSLEQATESASGFAITRRFEDPNTGVELANVKVGDVVRVVLRVQSGEEREHVALVDRLPAGLEPINPRLKTSIRDEEDERHRNDWARPVYWDAMEQHDDRVAIFTEHLWLHSDARFDYLARATTAGRFLLPGATVEEMYRPEHRARGATTFLAIAAK